MQVVGKHYSAIIEPEKAAELVRAIERYRCSLVVRCALQLSPLLFVRPGELRNAEWSEFDLDAAEWRIPAARLKQVKARKANER